MLTNTWFIADQHLHHSNILKFEKRSFEDIEEMNFFLIDSWNSVVKKNDLVYIVGDFCFGGKDKWVELLSKLKGEKILIKGNHDKSKIINRVLAEGHLKELHNVGTLIKLEKFFFNLTHYPLSIGERPFHFNISGHIHSRENDFINQINVGIDSPFMKKYYQENNVPFGTPVPFYYLLEETKKINEVISARYL